MYKPNSKAPTKTHKFRGFIVNEDMKLNLYIKTQKIRTGEEKQR